MKIFTGSSLIAFVFLMMAGSANADLIKNTSSSALSRFDLDPSFQIEKSEGLGGSVTLNESTKSVSLSVQLSPVCQPGAACPHWIRQVIAVAELPIVDVTIGKCNERIIVAEKDLLTVDGDHQTITIVDNSTNTCRYYIALPPVEVTYQTEGYNRAEGKSESSLSKFSGKPFKQMFFLQ